MNCQREKNNLFRNFAFLFRFPAQSTVSGVAFCGFLRFPALFVYPESPLLYFDRHEFQKIPNYFPVFTPPPRASNISLFALFCVRCFPCRSKRLKVIIPIVLFAYQKSLRRGLRPRRGYSFAYFSHRKANCLI